MAHFVISRPIAAPPDTVFDVITDHRAYPEYTPIRKTVLEREGAPEPDGVGAVRALHVAGPPLREEVVGYERPNRFVYKLLSGLPVRDHLGTVTISENGSGSLMRYEIDTTPTVPLVGAAVVGALKLGVGRIMTGVAGEAERRAATTAA
jgi:uncharacterized protein YndB with AHSA1/START domain